MSVGPLDPATDAGSDLHPEGLDYPLASPAPAALYGLLADCCLALRPATDARAAALAADRVRLARLEHLDQLYGPSPPAAGAESPPVRAVLANAQGLTLFDTAWAPGPADAIAFDAGRLRVYAWVVPSSGAMLTLAVRRGLSAGQWARRGPVDAAIVPGPGEAFLDPRAAQPAPVWVSEILPLGAESDPALGPARPLARAQGAHLDAEVSGEADALGVEVGVVAIGCAPGAGLGRAPADCGGDGRVETLGGAGPGDGGDLRLAAAAGDCIRVRPALRIDRPGGGAPVAVPVPGVLVVESSCPPCGDCPDLEAAYRALRRLWQAARLEALRLSHARDRLAEAACRWRAAAECRAARRVRLAVRPAGDRHLVVAAQLSNPSRGLLSEARLEIRVRLDAGSGPGDAAGAMIPPGASAVRLGPAWAPLEPAALPGGAGWSFRRGDAAQAAPAAGDLGGYDALRIRTRVALADPPPPGATVVVEARGEGAGPDGPEGPWHARAAYTYPLPPPTGS